MTSNSVSVACPDCGHAGMWKRNGQFGPYLACQRLSCGGRRKVTADWVPLDRDDSTATRKARMAAHAAFDPLWQSAERLYEEGCKVNRVRRVARSRAYRWLGSQLGLTPAEAHMDLFDRATCARVVEVCAGMTDERIRAWVHEQKAAHAHDVPEGDK